MKGKKPTQKELQDVLREHKKASEYEYLNLQNCIKLRFRPSTTGDNPAVDAIDSVTGRTIGSFPSYREANIAIDKAIKVINNAPPHESW